jgi:hypothetical protein
MAWELSQKTNQHIGVVWEKEKTLYVMEQSNQRDKQDLE